MTATHYGKGSTPRPVDKKKFDENWDKIWGKKSDNVFLDLGFDKVEAEQLKKDSDIIIENKLQSNENK